jgi:hypothetical protein
MGAMPAPIGEGERAVLAAVHPMSPCRNIHPSGVHSTFANLLDGALRKEVAQLT